MCKKDYYYYLLGIYGIRAAKAIDSLYIFNCLKNSLTIIFLKFNNIFFDMLYQSRITLFDLA